MATLLHSVAERKLLKLDPQLESGEREWRHIYLLPRLRDRLGTDLPKWGAQWDISQTPLQQFDTLAEISAQARR